MGKKTYVGGKTQKYVKANDTQAYSEGQGYGMLATVLAAKKKVQIRIQLTTKCTGTTGLTEFLAVIH
ncbi:hypothetical protein [Secundilactobacillus oryzae]|uniref:hypothetical protein n=1 Tax=Secundilactobacillus oryzae TaxID=1202668 RepID=UPI002092F482|nr:hypothetical protein [Secundilactobacillus oryzae]